MRAIEFTVLGIPAQQGSKWAFVNKHTGRAQMLDNKSAQLKQWRSAVIEKARAALDALSDSSPFEVCQVKLEFSYVRPASHFKKSGELKSTAPNNKITAPDLDKLVRAVNDALTQAAVIRDDKVIVHSRESKLWGISPGVTVTVIELP